MAKHGQERPGGRTEVVRQAVAQTVLDLLKEGRADFSMAEVAERAGIHRSTLYKRWQTQEELIQEALTLHADKIKIPNTGVWKKDLKALLKSLAEFVTDPLEIAIVRAMIDPNNPNLSGQVLAFWSPLMGQQILPITRAQARGELSVSLDPKLLLSLMLSPLLLHALVVGTPVSSSYIRQLETMLSQIGKPG